jgi:hypothetical protein
MENLNTASTLAKAWREETLEFNDALACHLDDNLGLMPDPALILGIGMAVSWANMGLPEIVLDLPGYQEMTAGEIVRRFEVQPFLESTE